MDDQNRLAKRVASVMTAGHLLFMMIAYMLAACGFNDETRSWSGSLAVVDGVELVRNPIEPLYSAQAASVRRLWTAPGHDPMRYWEEPAAVRGNGQRVFVLDRMAGQIHVVSASAGLWERSIAQRGQGPGELERPYGFVVAGAEIVVGDQSKASLERFGIDGAHRGSIHVGEMGFALATLGEDEFLLLSLLGGEGGWKRVARDGVILPFQWPAISPALPELEEGCARTTSAPEFVFRLDCHRLAFQIISSSGKVVREVLTERPVQRTPAAKLEAHLREIRQRMAQSGLPDPLIDLQLERERERFELSPSMRSVVQDPTTGQYAVWEQEPDDLGSSPALLHIFSPLGHYLTNVAFDTPWVDFDWFGDRLYALIRDVDTDLVELAAYELQLPSFKD